LLISKSPDLNPLEMWVLYWDAI